jgi:hypothetical protein
MLTIYGSQSRFCDGISRRNFLKIGALGLGGLALPQILQAQSAAGIRLSQKAVIMIYLPGGPPHQDMWEIKTEAPVAGRAVQLALMPLLQRRVEVAHSSFVPFGGALRFPVQRTNLKGRAVCGAPAHRRWFARDCSLPRFPQVHLSWHGFSRLGSFVARRRVQLRQ